MSGYLAVPAGPPPAPWPGVVVIHESWGLNGDIRAHADRLAAQGYLALAPDLYRGRSFVRCLRGVFQQLRAGSGPAFDLINEARAALAARPDCTGKIGVVGFCMGGGFALLCAPRGEFSAASVNYGQVPADAARVLAGSCPIVASYGARDQMGIEPPRRLEAALTTLEAAEDSWHRILAFFGEHLQS
jgi:carboxymethylenebutenolidase